MGWLVCRSSNWLGNNLVDLQQAKETSNKQDEVLKHIEQLEERHEHILQKILMLEEKIDSIIEKR
jgi:hypothetical protein